MSQCWSTKADLAKIDVVLAISHFFICVFVGALLTGVKWERLSWEKVTHTTMHQLGLSDECIKASKFCLIKANSHGPGEFQSVNLLINNKESFFSQT